MSIHDKDLFTGRDKVETAVERIRTFCAGKKTLLAFSGGKDSQTCYHLAKMAGVEFSAQYSITRFEPPELMAFIKEHYPDVTYRRAYKRNLVDDIEANGLPNRWFRWCCEAKHKKTPGFDITIVGVRAAESPRRKANWRMFGRKQDKTAYICPIIDWTDADVWEFLNENHIPHCRLYDEGERRIGCVCCPLNPSRMRSDAKKWPKTVAVLFLGHKRNWDRAASLGGVTKHGCFFRMLEFGTPEAAFENWLDTGTTIKSGKTEEEEPCLFAGTGFSESDAADGGEGDDA